MSDLKIIEGEFTHRGNCSIKSEDGTKEFNARFDGCVHIHDYNDNNIENGIVEIEAGRKMVYMHICDLEKYIEDLQKVRELAKKHFGDKWPNQ